MRDSVAGDSVAGDSGAGPGGPPRGPGAEGPPAGERGADLDPARGLANGLLIGVPAWVGLAAAARGEGRAALAAAAACLLAALFAARGGARDPAGRGATMIRGDDSGDDC